MNHIEYIKITMFNKIIDGKTPFFLSNFQNETDVTICTGEILTCNNVHEIKNLKQNKVVVLLPFSSVKEKYRFVKDCGRKITVFNIKNEQKITIEELLKLEYLQNLCEVNNFDFLSSDHQFKSDVQDVIDNEIMAGEGSNFMISRKGTGLIKDFNIEKALGLFMRMLKNEYGAYQTFCFFTGEEFLIGTSPECHISLQNGQARMQPISGTFRKTDDSIEMEKQKILKFLRDKKEINELFMTVDEELKTMAKICPLGGRILGPRLREMSRVIHTEYLLTGKTQMDVYDLILESMHAATLVGSPLENAFKIIQKYNTFDKEYYGSLIGIIDENNDFNSSIIIRTIRISNDGSFSVFGGASIVRDSIPEEELLESKAKMLNLLDNLTKNIDAKQKVLPFLALDHEIFEAQFERNRGLSHFWFFESMKRFENEDLSGKKAIIIENEDLFTQMLEHILNKIGIFTKIINYKDYKIEDSAGFDITIIGPGPGDPNDISSSKMLKLNNVTEKLLQKNIKILGICLGHQILAKSLGFSVQKASKIMQGEAKMIDLFGSMELVGFYNTFFAILEENSYGCNVSYDKNTKNIYALEGKNLASFQFHPESLLTQNGFDIIKNALLKLI